MAIVRIQYNEGTNKPTLGYTHVELNHDGVRTIFDSGDFVQDWFDMNKFIMLNQLQFVSFSSSVDHFIMDGGSELYDSIYLRYNEKLQEWYLDSKYDHKNEGYEFFVNKGQTPTWEELKDMYND